MKNMNNAKKSQNMMMSNTNLVILLVIVLVVGAFMWKSFVKTDTLSQTEVMMVDEIESKDDLTEAANELDSVNVDGDIDPSLTEVYSDAQTMK